MATEFHPTTFIFGDRAGQGQWEIGHYRQHVRYVDFLAAQTVPILLADHPIISMGKNDFQRRIWLQDHANVHVILRTYANITGVDLAAVNFEDGDEFTVWLDSHATEHGLIDQAFGL